MSQSVNIPNFHSRNILGNTLLTQDVAAGVSSLPVQNGLDFTNTTVLIGSPGSQTAELNAALTPSVATTMPLGSPTKLAHNFNDPVLQLFSSYMNVYSASDVLKNGTAPPDTNFGFIGTVAMDASKTETLFVDSSGVVGTWYKWTYYNPVSNIETALADSSAVQAGLSHYVSLDKIRRAAGFRTNTNITDDIIAEFRDAAEREVIGELQAVYVLPLPQPTNPIVVEIVKNIAAGELMHEMYIETNPSMAAEGEVKANAARNGGGSHTSLAELVDRSVVLLDGNYIEETIDEAHGFGGWPDETTAHLSRRDGGDRGFHFTVDKEY